MELYESYEVLFPNPLTFVTLRRENASGTLFLVLLNYPHFNSSLYPLFLYPTHILRPWTLVNGRTAHHIRPDSLYESYAHALHYLYRVCTFMGDDFDASLAIRFFDLPLHSTIFVSAY